MEKGKEWSFLCDKTKITVFEGYKRKKKFLVVYIYPTADEALEVSVPFAKRFFRCSKNHLMIRIGYIYNNELYFDKPRRCGQRHVYVIYYKRWTIEEELKKSGSEV